MSKKIAFPEYKTSEVISSLLEDPTFTSALTQYASSINASPSDLSKKCEKIFKEITSKYKPGGISFTKKIMRLVQKALFSNIHTYGYDLHSLSKDTNLLLLPTHRSHIDYLFLSYVFTLHDIAPPHIAAGVNLSFFPAGGMFRRLGAFFIRRKISGNFLYLLCLKSYLRWLTHHPLSIELFIEGGRSRDGRIKKPQTGILQLILEGLSSAPTNNYKILPVSISYDFTPEVPAYIREEQGLPKKKESLFSLLSTLTKVEKYHNIHFNFLNPIDVNTWMQSSGCTKDSVKQLALEVMQTTQSGMIVTAIQVMACAILESSKPIFEDDLYQNCLHIRNYLTSQNATLSDEAKHFESTFPMILEKILKKNWLVRKPGFRFEIGKDIQTLTYYKYAILHFFLPILFTELPKELSPTLQKLLTHDFPILPPELQSKVQANTYSPLAKQVAVSALKPYMNITHAQDPDQNGSNQAISVKKSKHAQSFISKQPAEEIQTLQKVFDFFTENSA